MKDGSRTELDEDSYFKGQGGRRKDWEEGESVYTPDGDKDVRDDLALRGKTGAAQGHTLGQFPGSSVLLPGNPAISRVAPTRLRLIKQS